MKQQANTTNRQSAFVLPTVLVLSVVLLALGLSVFQLTSSIARSLTDQYWQRLARQASQAGISYMSACVDQGLSSSTWPISITQDNTCLGTPLGTQPSIYTNTGDANPVPNPFQARFTIYKPTTGADGIPKARVVGAVDILSSPNSSGVRTTIKTYTYEMVSIINGTIDHISEIAGGTDHTCAKIDGKAFCWGSNASGQLGDGTNTTSSTPKAVSTTGVLNNKILTQLSATRATSCAVASGQVYCWGEGSDGQLGNGFSVDSNIPVKVTTAPGLLENKVVTQVSAGPYHTCAVASGLAYCWGKNNYGKLGDGSTTDSNVPVQVSMAGAMAGRTIEQVTVGLQHSCALASNITDQRIYCWGGNYQGQFGNGNYTNNTVVTPTNTAGVLSGRKVTQISSGQTFMCALASGRVSCWGAGSVGQLGNAASSISNLPVDVDTSGVLNAKVVSKIATGAHYACAIANGEAFCWGDNGFGQLGNGLSTDSNVPVAVSTSGLLANKAIIDFADNTEYHSCAIAESQSYCWGKNNTGTLGNGQITNSSTPVKTFSSFN